MSTPTNHILRLILGDQLNYQHSWYKTVNDDVVYVIMEMKQETDYTLHHAQKLIGFFAAMYNFATWLRRRGHKVEHWLINEQQNKHHLKKNLDYLVTKHRITAFEYQLPDEYRLDQQLKTIAAELDIPVTTIDTEHFFSSREELGSFFGARTPLMESFYRYMRKKHKILVNDSNEPVGKEWNFDKANRKSLPSGLRLPQAYLFQHDYSSIWKEIEKAGIKSFGNPMAAAFPWPTSRKQSLQTLRYFIKHLLPFFGAYQDALTQRSTYLFHSRLSFALNTKMISPKEVILAVVSAFEGGAASIEAVEGFVRQILGWREFMRGIYWNNMPSYSQLNYFKHQRPLPHWFWTGDTNMNCLQHSITQSLDSAYAHHIQRLMIIGNFSLLAGLSPDELDQWYLGIYIDAIEWVEITNTRGMSQFADGGIAGTKPYVSSASYISKMSDYCKNCYYKASEKTGEKSCPFNSLYWQFYDRHRKQLEGNPRIGMVYKTLDKMDNEKLDALKKQASIYLKNINEL